MERNRLLIIIIWCVGCSNHNLEKVNIKIEGLFNPLEIGLNDIYLKEDRYFSINIMNNDSLPLTLSTQRNGKFYSPSATEYSYFDEKYKKRKKGRGIGDFFSNEETIIPSFKSREFYFYASIPPNTDTVSFSFYYVKEGSTCFLETSYLLKSNKIVNQINYNNFCE